MSTRTIFLARLLGLYCIVVALFMFTHKTATVDTVSNLVHSQTQLLLIGLIGVSCGLALVLGHNVWSGGALPVLVTLTGWLSLIKGLAVLFLPPVSASVFFLDTLQYERFFYGYTSFTAVLGIILVAMSLSHRTRRISVTTEADLFSELTAVK